MEHALTTVTGLAASTGLEAASLDTRRHLGRRPIHRDRASYFNLSQVSREHSRNGEGTRYARIHLPGPILQRRHKRVTGVFLRFAVTRVVTLRIGVEIDSIVGRWLCLEVDTKTDERIGQADHTQRREIQQVVGSDIGVPGAVVRRESVAVQVDGEPAVGVNAVAEYVIVDRVTDARAVSLPGQEDAVATVECDGVSLACACAPNSGSFCPPGFDTVSAVAEWRDAVCLCSDQVSFDHSITDKAEAES